MIFFSPKNTGIVFQNVSQISFKMMYSSHLVWDEGRGQRYINADESFGTTKDQLLSTDSRFVLCTQVQKIPYLQHLLFLHKKRWFLGYFLSVWPRDQLAGEIKTVLVQKAIGKPLADFTKLTSAAFKQKTVKCDVSNVLLFFEDLHPTPLSQPVLDELNAVKIEQTVEWEGGEEEEEENNSTTLVATSTSLTIVKPKKKKRPTSEPLPQHKRKKKSKRVQEKNKDELEFPNQDHELTYYVLYVLEQMVKHGFLFTTVEEFYDWLEDTYLRPSRVLREIDPNTTEMQLPAFVDCNQAMRYLMQFKQRNSAIYMKWERKYKRGRTTTNN